MIKFNSSNIEVEFVKICEVCIGGNYYYTTLYVKEYYSTNPSCWYRRPLSLTPWDQVLFGYENIVSKTW